MEQPDLELDLDKYIDAEKMGPGITGTAGDGNTMSSTGGDLTMDDEDEH
jgi:hypothetical protein